MISIIIPYIREKGMQRCVKAIERHSGIERDRYEIIVEHDKARIGCPKMVRMLTEKARFDLVMFLADDTIPQPNFMYNALCAMSELSDGWGMVGLNDGFHNGNILATHWMASKKLLPLIGGEFFHTGYQHCFCDQELMGRCKKLGRYIWSEDALIWHRHPVLCQLDGPDDDYRRIYSEEIFEADKALFESRRRLWE